AQRLVSTSGAKSKLDQLRQIVYITLPEHDPIYVQTCLEWHRLSENIQQLESESSDVAPQPVNNAQIEEMTMKSARHKLLTQRLAENQAALAKVPLPGKTLEELDAEIEVQLQSQKEIQQALSRNNITV